MRSESDAGAAAFMDGMFGAWLHLPQVHLSGIIVARREHCMAVTQCPPVAIFANPQLATGD